MRNTRRTRRALGSAAGSTLCLDLAVVVGIVPHPDGTKTVSAADSRSLIVAVPSVDAGLAGFPPEATSTIAITIPPTTPAPSPPAATAVAPVEVAAPEPPPTTVAEVVPVTAPAEASPAPTPPAATAVPRRQPSSAEVQQAIAGVRPYVRSLFPVNPTPDQVAELGDKICTAFDQGQTLAQVKATGAELVNKVPFATLLPGGDDYIVRTGVALYCPGHADKLG